MTVRAKGPIGRALRALWRSPAFSLTAILTLGLALGLNTAVFSVVYGILLKPLDLPRSDRLYLVGQDMQRRGGDGLESTGRGVLTEWRARSRSFEGMTGYITFPAELGGDALPESVPAAVVSHEYFEVLGVEPLLGRSFQRSEETEGRHFVAVLSHDLWQRRFGGDRGILGRPILVNGMEHVVVGVMPPELRSPLTPDVELWAPLPLDPVAPDWGHSYVRVFGRLADGVTPAVAAREMDRIAGQLAAEHPELEDVGAAIEPLLSSIVGSSRQLLLLLFAATSLVLLAAFANLTSLVVSRAAAREQELALRTALGAGRRQLGKQMLFEAVLLAIFGVALALVLALLGIELLRFFAPPQLPRLDAIRLGPAVLVYSLALAAVGAVVSAVLPLLRASRRPTATVLRGAADVGGGRRERRWRSATVVLEIGLGLVLLVGAGALVRTLVNLSAIDIGFRAEDLVLGTVNLSPGRFPDEVALVSFVERVEGALLQRPELADVGLVSAAPIAETAGREALLVERDLPAANERTAVVRAVTPGFFGTLGIRLVSGRPIGRGDHPRSTPVVVVNREFVERHLQEGAPVGRRVRFAEEAVGAPWRTIVGVVDDVRGDRLDEPPQPEVYLPVAQWPARRLTILARTTAPTDAAFTAVREAVYGAEPGLVVADLTTMEEEISRTLAVRRFLTLLLGAFAAITLVLVAVGLYGVTALAVGQRRREIAVRLAMGAVPRSVVAMVLAWSGILVAAGIAIGLTLAISAGSALDRFLYGVEPLDPVSVLATVLLVAVIGMVATLSPAISAARIDPASTLKAT